MNSVKDVDIDPSGRFKYILIKVSGGLGSVAEKLIVRGYARCGYHQDILDEVSPAIEALNLQTACLGGGRIQHSPGEKALLVYGYSQGFGQADHSKAVALLQKTFPDYTITSSNDGY